MERACRHELFLIGLAMAFEPPLGAVNMSRRRWMISGVAVAGVLVGVLAWGFWPKGQPPAPPVAVSPATSDSGQDQPSRPASPPAVATSSDTDHDGLPDEWEMKYFGSIKKYGPTDSPSGDGVPNGFKFWKNLDPLVEWVPPRPPENPPRFSSYVSGPGTGPKFSSLQYQRDYWAKHSTTQPAEGEGLATEGDEP